MVTGGLGVGVSSKSSSSRLRGVMMMLSGGDASNLSGSAVRYSSVASSVALGVVGDGGGVVVFRTSRRGILQVGGDISFS